MKPIEIILCDDHPLIAEGLLSFVEQQPLMEIKATAASGTELMEVLKTVSADILLLDINLPDESGLDLCLKIKKEYPDMKILALSNLTNGRYSEMLHHQGIGIPAKECRKEVNKPSTIHEAGFTLERNTTHSLLVHH